MARKENMYYVDYLLHAEISKDKLRVFVVGTGDEVPDAIKIHELIKGSPKFPNILSNFMSVSTRKRDINSLKWHGKVQNSSELLTENELKNRLIHAQKGGEWFGVWGKEQLEFFEKFLDNVIDISSIFMKKMLRKKAIPYEEEEFSEEDYCAGIDPNDHCRWPLTILALFENMVLVCKNDYGSMSLKSNREKFQKWIEETAWKQLFRL